MRLLLILLNFLLCQSLLGQDCSYDSLFIRFKYDVQIEMLNDNEIEWCDVTKESYYKLMIDCPISCLVKYTDDSIPAIRAMIFGGLIEKNVDDDILGEILDRHKNDTAQFILSSTCVVDTWTVSRYMQLRLKFKSKANNKTFNTADVFESRLKNLRSRLQETIRIYIPGEYHGLVTKDDLLLIDSLTCTLQGYRIVSFDLISGTKTFSTNNVFTQEIKDFIKTMTSGDHIHIYEIRVEFPDKTIGQIGGISLRIK